MAGTVILEQSLQEQAFSVRKKHFTDHIKFFAPGLKSYNIPGFRQKNPSAFLPVSLTGNACALNCDHCDTRILDPMIPLDRKLGLFEMCKKMAQNGTKSVLISGGSNKKGQVPFLNYIGEIARIKSELGLKIIMHTGLVNREMVIGLRKANVDGVAIDIIGSDKTIKEVYHLEATTEDFDKSLKLLTEYGLSIRPHIILGLHYGKMAGEYEALEMIAKYPIHALVLVILNPLHDTPMQGIDPPPAQEIETFFYKARIRMPESKILVGCARPGGNYKVKVDKAAVAAGLNGIAYPAEGIIEYAKKRGLDPLFYEDSCSCGVE